MRGMSLSSVRSVASTELVKNLNAEYLNGNKNYFPKKSISITLLSNMWYRIATMTINNGVPWSSNVIFGIEIYQGNQSLAYIFTWSSSHNFSFLYQIGSSSYVNNLFAKLRLVKESETKFHLEINNSYGSSYNFTLDLLDFRSKCTVLSSPWFNESDSNVIQTLTCQRYPNSSSADTSSQLTDLQSSEMGGVAESLDLAMLLLTLQSLNKERRLR